ncbi:28360_t:CDS:2 [Gigaspora margarita]|uniref:28360_t:CDS:1 n=1 Tax=Gigaspora margarita TaxID=4874 RepID=A0ABN7UVX1_GIGMA|nr:28360_t:CDS:2 [Gigaspora margarita]
MTRHSKEWFYEKQIKLYNYRKFSKPKEVGRGGYGTVYKVAIKRLDFALKKLIVEENDEKNEKTIRKNDKEHHPDKSQTSLTNSEGMNKNEKVNQIIEAWKILKDPELRKVYDKELKATKLRHDGLFNSEIDLDDMEYDQGKYPP